MEQNGMPSVEKGTYTVDEAAIILGVHKASLFRAIERGEYKDIVIRCGRRILIGKKALERLLSGQSVCA